MQDKIEVGGKLQVDELVWDYWKGEKEDSNV
jgi:hypothetical protein